jgi:small nuclear ribonucleoprotein (snRNP)-like protein
MSQVCFTVVLGCFAFKRSKVILSLYRLPEWPRLDRPSLGFRGMFQPPNYRETSGSAKATYTITHNFLNKQVMIRVTDGRYFQGQFVCVDHECNVILQGAHEYQNEQGDGKRWYGMVMIPGKHMKEIRVKVGRTSLTQQSSLCI